LIINLRARAAIELFLMYVSRKWHPWIGIGHDIFSVLLMPFVLRPCFRDTDRLYCGFLLVASGMYVPEAFSAWYMLAKAAVPGTTVYFVPDDPVHNGIMIVTTVCVLLLLIYLIAFYRRWLSGQNES
jgi:hypothetical protein